MFFDSESLDKQIPLHLVDPDYPNYKGITVNTPTDVEYTGTNQTWLPTVTGMLINT